MELFYSDNVGGSSLTLTPEDSLHCARVLRHRTGDIINVIDGLGTMFECKVVSDNPRLVTADILSSTPQWHSHPYRLTMAVCPTKNNERFEWFVEKAVEVGVDAICPLEGERSERRVYKAERAAKIALSAAKQSLKASLPVIADMQTVKDFLNGPRSGLKAIACCFDDPDTPRRSLMNLLTENAGKTGEVTILIGPEGDFSAEEASLAIRNGYVPVHLGESRLRTETAAVVALTQVYSVFL